MNNQRLAYWRLATAIRQKYLRHSIGGKNQNYQPFILLTSGRSGSTWFISLLQSHPTVLAFGDVFGEQLFSKQQDLKLSDPESFIKTVLFKSTAGVFKALGFKVFFDFYQTHHNLFNKLQHDFPNLKYILLERDLDLDEYMSLQVAEKSGIWSRTVFESIKNPAPINVSLEEFRLYSEKKQQALALIQSNIGSENLFKISYESLTKHPELILAKVQRFLGVEQRDLVSFFRPVYDHSVRDLVLNADELEAFALSHHKPTN